MNYIKALIISAVVALAIVFMIQNMDALSHPLSLRLNLLFYNFESAPFATYLIILLSFFVGLLIASLLGIVERARLRGRIKAKQKEVDSLQGELQSLRTLPLTEQGGAAAGDRAAQAQPEPETEQAQEAKE